jgi:hypothetical protein
MSRIGKAILSVVLMLVACSACTRSASSSAPTEEDGKALLMQKLERIFVPPFSIESFARTSGKEKAQSGVEIYDMAFTAVMKYPSDDIKCVFPYCPQLSDPNLRAVFDKAKKTVAITGSLTFEKTPSGWVGQL